MNTDEMRRTIAPLAAIEGDIPLRGCDRDYRGTDLSPARGHSQGRTGNLPVDRAGNCAGAAAPPLRR